MKAEFNGLRQYGMGASICGDASVCAAPRFYARLQKLREMTKQEWFAFGSAVGIIKCNDEILGTSTIYQVSGNDRDVLVGAGNASLAGEAHTLVENCYFHPAKLQNKQPQSRGYALKTEKTEFLFSSENKPASNRTIYTAKDNISLLHGAIPFIHLTEARLQQYVDQGARILVAGYSRAEKRLMISDRCVSHLQDAYDLRAQKKSSIYFKNCNLDDGFTGASVLLHFPRGVLGQRESYFAFCTQFSDNITSSGRRCRSFEKPFERALLGLAKS